MKQYLNCDYFLTTAVDLYWLLYMLLVALLNIIFCYIRRHLLMLICDHEFLYF